MTNGDYRTEKREFSEETESLMRITLAPLIWALHFAVSYASTAIWCAKFAAEGESIFGFRLAVAAMTLLALGGIGWLGWRAWQQWDYLGDRDYENHEAHEEDRHQFLGHAAFLLAIISFVGVIYVALPALFIRTCM